MLALTEKLLRTTFVNASRKEVADLTLPLDFDSIDWETRDYLGWRDPRLAKRAYVVVPDLDGGLIGILLRRADATPRSRTQCTWCEDYRLPNDVVYYSAKRSGVSGRNGDSVATLICEDFQCSRNVRVLPLLAYEGFDVEAARVRRIENLQLKAAAFAVAL